MKSIILNLTFSTSQNVQPKSKQQINDNKLLFGELLKMKPNKSIKIEINQDVFLLIIFQFTSKYATINIAIIMKPKRLNIVNLKM